MHPCRMRNQIIQTWNLSTSHGSEPRISKSGLGNEKEKETQLQGDEKAEILSAHRSCNGSRSGGTTVRINLVCICAIPSISISYRSRKK